MNNKKTIIKYAYLLSAEDPSDTKKVRHFIVLDVPNLNNSIYVDIKGYELKKAQLDKINNEYEHLKTLAENNDMINIIIPWHRIINIKNLMYTNSKR